MLAKLIRIYTPFICAIIAIIHGVLYFTDCDGVIFSIFGEIAGHSILAILYIIATSKRMCKWYKITNYLLLSIHFVNLLYIAGFVGFYLLLYAGLTINILALITFLIYRVTVGITKILC